MDNTPHKQSPELATVPPAPTATLDNGIADEPGKTDQESFDFEAHRRDAVDAYQAVRTEYEECAQTVRSVLRTILAANEIMALSVDARAKEIDSFAKKAITPSDLDPSQPKYPKPLEQITDLSGARVVTYLLDDVAKVNELVEREFEVVEKSDKSRLLKDHEKLGYQSTHFLVRFQANRCGLPEYERFAGRITEIQVRTVLQHAWAEIEHDIQYKAISTVTASIRRRLMSLAGLLEIGDREFQTISDDHERERTNARRLVDQGELSQIPITPDALKAYLDKKYGPDGRVSPWTYQWIARVVRRQGIDDLRALDITIAAYDDDAVSRAVWGSRQGQVRRLEAVLLAAIGEPFSAGRAQPDDAGELLTERDAAILERLRECDIPVGTYQHGRTDSADPPPAPG